MLRVAVLGAGRIGKIHARNVTLNPRCKLWRSPIRSRRRRNRLPTISAANPRRAPAPPSPARMSMRSSSAPRPTPISISPSKGRAAAKKPCLLRETDRSRHQEGRRLLSADDRRNSRPSVMIAFNRRFDPSVSRTQEGATRRGRHRHRPIKVVINTAAIHLRRPPPTPRARAEIFRDMTIHDFDMARFLSARSRSRSMGIGDLHWSIRRSAPPATYARLMAILKTTSRASTMPHQQTRPKSGLWLRPALRGVRFQGHAAQ